MSDVVVNAPTDKTVKAFNTALDALITGLGPDAALAALNEGVPFTALPVIRTVVKFIVDQIAEYLDEKGKEIADAMVIRYQNDELKTKYDQALQTIQGEGTTDAQVQAAFDAINSIVNRSK